MLSSIKRCFQRLVTCIGVPLDPHRSASFETLSYESLPPFRQDNEFIQRGYRPENLSLFQCIASIFRIHTETVNIWTHLAGSIFFLYRTIVFLCQPYSLEQKLLFSAFMLTAVICMGLSFAYHTFTCHSRDLDFIFSRLDYCGIAMLIMGSVIPWLYYAFYCDTLPRFFYLATSSLLCAVCIIMSLHRKFSQSVYRAKRASVFLAFGLSSILPLVTFLYLHGWEKAVREAAVHWLILMGLLYVLGTLLYVLRVPERFYPGRCDIWFHSHQIFHMLVIAAAFVHFHGISEMAAYRIMKGGKCS